MRLAALALLGRVSFVWFSRGEDKWVAMRIHVGRAKTEGPLGSEKQGSPSDLPGEKIQKNRLIRGTDRNFRILTFWALFWPILNLPPWATKQMRFAHMESF